MRSVSNLIFTHQVTDRQHRDKIASKLIIRGSQDHALLGPQGFRLLARSPFSFMPHYCYIIYSHHLDKYYIGETSDFSNRMEMHNSGFSSFTSKTNDWKLHLLIPCPHKSVALKVEAHIKSMKSRKYIENLALYPDMTAKLVSKFAQ